MPSAEPNQQINYAQQDQKKLNFYYFTKWKIKLSPA